MCFIYCTLFWGINMRETLNAIDAFKREKKGRDFRGWRGVGITKLV